MKSKANHFLEQAPDGDWLDTAIVLAAPAEPPDDGFTNRVLTQLNLSRPASSPASPQERLARQGQLIQRHDALLALACLLGMLVPITVMGWPTADALSQMVDFLKWPPTGGGPWGPVLSSILATCLLAYGLVRFRP